MWLNDWLTDWWMKLVTDWLSDGLTDWLTEQMFDWLNYEFDVQAEHLFTLPSFRISNFRFRFFRRTLNHDNVVRLHGVGIKGPRNFMVHENLTNGNIATITFFLIRCFSSCSSGIEGLILAYNHLGWQSYCCYSKILQESHLISVLARFYTNYASKP